MQTTLFGRLAAAGLLGLALAGTATTAHAATGIACPNTGSTISAQWNHAKANGTVVDEYFDSANNSFVVYHVDNHYEMFGTNYLTIQRACFDDEPERPDDARDTQQRTGGGPSEIMQMIGAGIRGYHLSAPDYPTGTVTVGEPEPV